MSYESKPWISKYDKEVPPEIDPELFETTLIDLIMPSFKEFPDKFACHFLGVNFTFADIDRYSNQFANMLVENGLQPGDVVGLSLVNTPQYLIAYVGILKAGCAATGLSPLFSESELEYQLKDANAKGVVVIDAAFAGRLKNIADKLPNLKVIVATNVGDFLPGIKRFLGKLLKKLPKGKVTPLPGKNVIKFMEILKNFPTTFEIRKTNPDSMCLLMYTGGTTGFPKGSILTNRNVCSNILQMATWLELWPDRGKDTALSGFPFFHIAGKTFCNMCLYTAATQILIPNPRDTHLICKEIKKFSPSELVNVPSLYQMLMNNPQFKTLDFSNLKFAISSAAPFPVESINELERTIGKEKLIEV